MKPIVFICSGSIKSGDKKLSFRVANYLFQQGLAELGETERLPDIVGNGDAPMLLFVSDCRTGCVRMLTEGLAADRFLFLDLYEHRSAHDFDIPSFVEKEVAPRIRQIEHSAS